MDVKTQGSEVAENMNSSQSYVFNDMKRSCIACHTTRTPLWRGGPAGPRSLCNACGIRYRKKKKALLGLNNGRTEKRGRKNIKDNSELQVSLKMGLIAAGREMMLQKSIGEEEQAAMLLMALSCGNVYA